MTIEIGTTPPPRNGDARAAAVRALLATMRKGNGSAHVLKSILASANLPAEQASLLDELLELGSHDEDEPEAIVLGAGDDRRADEPARPHGMPCHVPQEVEDLRQANDTLASALGACPICWGGDLACEVCAGRGRAGYAAPDPALFREFVLPAVERVRAMRRSPARRRRE